jgi:hypothetical protein
MKPDASSTAFSSWIGKANRQNQMKLRGTMPSWKDQRLSFARAHIAQLVYDRVEFEDAIAILYRIVGQSLLKYRPLSYYERQNQLATPKRALDTPSDLRRPHIAAAAADTTSTVLKHIMIAPSSATRWYPNNRQSVSAKLRHPRHTQRARADRAIQDFKPASPSVGPPLRSYREPVKPPRSSSEDEQQNDDDYE